MTSARLTDLTVRQLPYTEAGQVRYFDETTPNFGLTVGKRTKTFFVLVGSKRQLTTLGRYPEISLQDARKAAKRLLVQETQENTATGTVAAVAMYLEAIKSKVRPSTWSEYARYLKTAPDIPLSELSRQHIDTTSPHVVMAWRVFMNWCIAEELTDRNPFKNIAVQYGERSRVLTDDEIKAIWQYDHPPFSHIIKLCILTGQRKGEVEQFKADWVRGDTITIPASVAKNGKEHTLPFNLLTAQYLRQYLGSSFNGWSKGKARLDKHIPLPPWTIHDLRRTFSTTHARLGTPIHVTERLINHVSGSISGVSAIYNRHNYLKEMQEASLQYELFIANLVGAKA